MGAQRALRRMGLPSEISRTARRLACEYQADAHSLNVERRTLNASCNFQIFKDGLWWLPVLVDLGE
jgi:hypothetical protein